MNRILSVFFLFFISGLSYSQTSDVWTAFEDKVSGLSGFRDSSGTIKVQPRYLGFMLAQKFSGISAVMEENNESYYLLKNGSRVGRDSVYISDNSFDCESEGFIRFRDKKTNKTGMFNSEGRAVIPAEYDEITPVMNGLTASLKDAEKVYPDINDDESCEHWSWTGGEQYLIDRDNHILVKNFSYHPQLDFNSLKIEDVPTDDSCRESFKGVDGRYYSFNNNEKLFKQWLINSFLKKLDRKGITENSYSEILYWTDDQGWLKRNSKDFIEENFELIKESLIPLRGTNSDYFISPEDFITCPASMDKEFEKYHNNCGELISSLYPVMNLVINHVSGNDSYQNNFSFLKTEDGFRLLNIYFGDTLPH